MLHDSHGHSQSLISFWVKIYQGFQKSKTFSKSKLFSLNESLTYSPVFISSAMFAAEFNQMMHFERNLMGWRFRRILWYLRTAVSFRKWVVDLFLEHQCCKHYVIHCSHRYSWNDIVHFPVTGNCEYISTKCHIWYFKPISLTYTWSNKGSPPLWFQTQSISINMYTILVNVIPWISHKLVGFTWVNFDPLQEIHRWGICEVGIYSFTRLQCID